MQRRGHYRRGRAGRRDGARAGAVEPRPLDHADRRDAARRRRQGARHRAGRAGRRLRHAAVRRDRRVDGRGRVDRDPRRSRHRRRMAGRRRAGAAEAPVADGARRGHSSAPGRRSASSSIAASASCKFARTRLFGSAPESLAAAARALVALAVNGSPRDVALSVLGVPPAHTVIPWADATVAGFALTRLVDEPSRRRLGARVAALWPPGPYALAAAATAVVEAMAGRSRRVASLLRRARRLRRHAHAHRRDAGQARACRHRRGRVAVVECRRAGRARQCDA